MWSARLQDNYVNFNEWRRYSQTYGLTKRLGFNSEEEAWDINPLIEGSVNPRDFKIVPI